MSENDPKLVVKNEPPKQPNMVSASEMSTIIAQAVADALKVAIPAAAIGINAANAQANDKNKAAMIREVMRRTKRCPICGLSETACGGAWSKDAEGKDIEKRHADGSPDYNYELNHIRAYAGPTDPNLFKWFQGMKVNGVRFLPDYFGHRQWIPKQSDILTQVNAWEADQHDQMQRRTAEGMGAGAIGPNGGIMHRGNQNAVGWR